MLPDPALDLKLREYLAACRDAPLDPADPRRVDLDARRVRGTDERTVLLQDVIELSAEKPTCQLFSGFRGTRKSTELRLLRERLARSGFLVLMGDAEQFHSLTRNLAIEELLPVIAGAFAAAAGDYLEDEALADTGWWSRFKVLLGRLAVEPALKMGPAELKATLRTGGVFSEHLQKALDGRLELLMHEIHAFTGPVIQLMRARSPGSVGVVFIFDNLEKLTGPVHEFRDRMDSVKRVFGDFHQHLRLPDCHTIYTVPLYLQAIFPEVPAFYDGRRMPVLPTVVLTGRDEARTPRPDGIEAMRAVIAARLPIQVVFASEEQSERLILASGGHLRSLLAMAGDLLLRARRKGLPFDDSEVDRVIDQHFESRREAVRADGVALLDGIRRTFTLDHVTSADHPLLARYFESNLVLCYRNGDGWYDLHPGIREAVRRRAAAMVSYTDT